MSILGHGVDLIECERIAGVLENHGQRFLSRVLTSAERQLSSRYRNPVPFISGRWAAKEALLKMIGTGWRGQIAWTDMEILPNDLGQPVVSLSGETARITKQMGITRILLSISHTDHSAMASAIGTGD